MSQEKVRKRLNRLIKSGICDAENVKECAQELRQLAQQTADKKAIQEKTRFFKALADETRLRILKLLETREMCVCEIMVALDLTQPTASHHLGLLEKVGLVTNEKRGKWVFYHITDQKLLDNMHKTNLL